MDSIQKGMNAKAKAANREVSPTCGDCSGFNCEILIEGAKKVCSKGDKIKSSATCPRFVPNVKEVGAVASELEGLAALIANMPDASVRALGILMFNESKTRKAKMRFMQRVYVRYRGAVNRDYVSNFMEAYVMYATPQHYKLMSKDGRCVLTYGEHCRPVIFTEEEFAEKLAVMKRKGNLVDPDTEQLIVRRFRAEEEHDLHIMSDKLTGSPSTIDEVFKSNGVAKGRKKGLPDLISLVADAAEGFNVEKRAKIYDKDVKRDKGEGSKLNMDGDRIVVRG